ncbi:hypothetical protein BDN70DRAFT_899572 [Pholiota conissans]|uniref:Uncharacterized protein n=1 Tax=Pholiota conissans TaxID=109636 RepID=A0A9P6CUZ8_9AGAR|nr:hypothetical protein BDN70DRAFT_899572 [Pholiota conissans]
MYCEEPRMKRNGWMHKTIRRTFGPWLEAINKRRYNCKTSEESCKTYTDLVLSAYKSNGCCGVALGVTSANHPSRVKSMQQFREITVSSNHHDVVPISRIQRIESSSLRPLPDATFHPNPALQRAESLRELQIPRYPAYTSYQPPHPSAIMPFAYGSPQTPFRRSFQVRGEVHAPAIVRWRPYVRDPVHLNGVRFTERNYRRVTIYNPIQGRTSLRSRIQAARLAHQIRERRMRIIPQIVEGRYVTRVRLIWGGFRKILRKLPILLSVNRRQRALRGTEN